MSPMFSFNGTPIGGGIVIGRARVLESNRLDADRIRLSLEQIAPEIERLLAALRAVRDELSVIARQLPADAPSEALALLDAHQMILDDPMLVDEAIQMIREQAFNAEYAIAQRAGQLAEQFEELEDPYLRERGQDVRQIAGRVLKYLSGTLTRPLGAGEPAIIVAADIAPADILALKHVQGFVIDLGGTTSHTAILARSMNVPAVVGVQCAARLVHDDDWLVVDGEAGVIFVSPDENVLAEYRHRQAAELLEREKLKRLINVPARTLDGVSIALQANIEAPEEAAIAYEAGAAGIGLFRSEFLFMNRAALPDEDEQYEAYRRAVEAMRGRPVTIRTLDVGADKALDEGESVAPPNPALGLRGIRFCLSRPTMFLNQLRAILRASAHGQVRILIPMLAHSLEIEHTLRLVEMAREQLLERGLACAPEVPIGGMIEVPAAALSAPLFARRLDFLSLGTNDLIQYTLAIDRADHQVASLYDSFHPAVLQLIAMTIRAGRRAGKPVSVCGELAGDWTACRLLLGMGLTSFSMHTASLLRVKREVLLADMTQLHVRVTRLLSQDDPVRVNNALTRLREDGGKDKIPG